MHTRFFKMHRMQFLLQGLLEGSVLFVGTQRHFFFTDWQFSLDTQVAEKGEKCIKSRQKSHHPNALHKNPETFTILCHLPIPWISAVILRKYLNSDFASFLIFFTFPFLSSNLISWTHIITPSTPIRFRLYKNSVNHISSYICIFTLWFGKFGQ